MNGQDFANKGKCVVLHLFNDHSCCRVDWCTHLKAAVEMDPKKKEKLYDPRKYRSTATKSEEKLFVKVKAKVMPLLCANKMAEIHHPFHTQKNETLQRQATAVAPKDKFLGGKMQLYDRLRLITILDSVGELEGLIRLYESIGLPPLHPVLALWAANKDKEDLRKHEYRKLPAVKRKRATEKIAKMKEGMLQEKRAKKMELHMNEVLRTKQTMQML